MRAIKNIFIIIWWSITLYLVWIMATGILLPILIWAWTVKFKIVITLIVLIAVVVIFRVVADRDYLDHLDGGGYG